MTALLYPALLYVLDSDHGTKIGITSQTIDERLSDLRRGSGCQGVTVVATFPFEDARSARLTESVAHWLLRDDRTVGEWFHCHPLLAVRTIERVVSRGVPLEFFDRARTAGRRL